MTVLIRFNDRHLIVAYFLGRHHVVAGLRTGCLLKKLSSWWHNQSDNSHCIPVYSQ